MGDMTKTPQKRRRGRCQIHVGAGAGSITRGGSAAPSGYATRPRGRQAASGPWGHSLETEERTNGLSLALPGDPKIYHRELELQDE